MVGERLTVLHEDEALIIVDKPAGIHTAPLRPGEPGTLLAAVIAAFPDVAAVPGMKPSEPGLLHRLDHETSGVVVFARTGAAFAALRSQFASGEAHKEYRAACACPPGRAPGETFEISSLFAPFGPGRRKVRVVEPAEKNRRLLRKAARPVYVTDVRLERVHEGRALVEVTLQRGFRHQVRAHLSHVGLPILGDALYGVPAPHEAPQRMYLHASGITLVHPVGAKRLRVVSPLPDAFRAVL